MTLCISPVSIVLLIRLHCTTFHVSHTMNSEFKILIGIGRNTDSRVFTILNRVGAAMWAHGMLFISRSYYPVR